MRWSLPAILFVILSYAPAYAVDMTDAEFYRLIDLDHPGMEDVRGALAARDTTTAHEALLEYYRLRTSVNYFSLPSGGNVAEADDNINHYFELVGVTQRASRDDGGIDWSMSYRGDNEWHWQFHRMDWLRNLARVYGRTGDEKYARAWAEHMVDWAANNPPGYPRTLDTGNRLRQWVESYQYVIHEYRTEAVSPEEHLAILKSMIQQVRFLRDNWRSTGNWGVSETRGIGAVVAMFPEFRFEEDTTREAWIDLVFSRLHHHLSRDFLADGVQFEVSPMYHGLAYRNILVTVELFAMNGIAASDDLLADLVRPAEFMMHVNRPDGAFSQLGDSDEVPYLADHLASAGELFGRDDMIWAATQGARGTPPDETFRLFEDGGFAFMRSDWGVDAASYRESKYLVMSYGSNQPWHAHYDILGIEIYAGGRAIIRDPGRYTYSTSDGWRDYFKGTSAHNTILVDGRDQANTVRGHARGAEGAGFAYVRAHHDGYPGLRHERRIVFVDGAYWIVSDLVTGSGTHTYELKYRLDTIYRNRTDIDDVTGAAVTRDFTLHPAHQRAEARVDLSWISPSYGERSAAPVVTFEQSGAPPIAFETAIVPFASRAAPESVARIEVHDGAGHVQSDDIAVALHVVFADGSSDQVIHNYGNARALTVDEVSLEGEMAVVGHLDGVTRYALYSGRALKHDDTFLVVVSDGDATVGMLGDKLTVEGASFGEVRAWAPAVTRVTLNDDPAGFNRDGDYVLVSGGQNTTSELDGVLAGSMTVSHYPNPVSADATIRIELADAGRLHLELFDVLGRRVNLLADEQLPAGSHDVMMSVASLPAGLYLLRAQNGTRIVTRTVTVVR